MRAAIAALTLMLGACGAPPSTYGLVIVNDSDEQVFWSIEQPDGTVSRFGVEPCSATSHRIEVGRAWEVEWGDAVVVSSAGVSPLDAPVTVIDVTFDAEGRPHLVVPHPAEFQPDAPLDRFSCVER